MLTRCPYCPRAYSYDNDTDSHEHAAEEVVWTSDGEQITLERCEDCRAVIAFFVVDGNGGQLYTPCREPV